MANLHALQQLQSPKKKLILINRSSQLYLLPYWGQRLCRLVTAQCLLLSWKERLTLWSPDSTLGTGTQRESGFQATTSYSLTQETSYEKHCL